MSDDELISAYLDGDLTPADQARVEGLIASRPEWREQHDDLVALRGEIANLPRFPAPSGLQGRILEAIAAQRAAEPKDAVEPRSAASWLSPLVGFVGASAVAASLAFALAAPQWFRAPADSNVAVRPPSDNIVSPAPPPAAKPAAAKADHETFAAGLSQGHEGKEVPANRARVAPAADGGKGLPETAAAGDAAPSAVNELPAPAVVALPAPAAPPAPSAPAPGAFAGGARDSQNYNAAAGQGGRGAGPKAGYAPKAAALDGALEREEAKKQVAFAARANELKDAVTLRSASSMLDEQGQTVTVLELQISADLPAEKAIAKLIAQADAALVTHPARREQWAGALRKNADRRVKNDALDGKAEELPAGDVLVLDLDAARAERLLASLAVAKSQFGGEPGQDKNRALRLHAAEANLEQDRQLTPPGEPAAPGKPADVAAKPAGPAASGPAPAEAMVLGRADVAKFMERAKEKRVFQAADEQPAERGEGVIANAKPAALAEKQLAERKNTDRRRILILLQPAK